MVANAEPCAHTTFAGLAGARAKRGGLRRRGAFFQAGESRAPRKTGLVQTLEYSFFVFGCVVSCRQTLRYQELLHVDGCYQPVDLEAALAEEKRPGGTALDLRALLQTLQADGYRGVNVTMPLKERALAALDSVDASAAEVGASNCIVFNADAPGEGDGAKRGFRAYNTDSSGFLRALKEALGENHQHRAELSHVLVLGAGGAGRAVACALLRAGARRVTIADTDLVKAERLVTDMAMLAESNGSAMVTIAPSNDFGAAVAAVLETATGVVNASPIGMTGFTASHAWLPEGGLPPGVRWAGDTVYSPVRTEFVRRAENAGLRTVKGDAMMLYQAVEGFERMNDLKLDPGHVAQMRTKLSELLAARGE